MPKSKPSPKAKRVNWKERAEYDCERAERFWTRLQIISKELSAMTVRAESAEKHNAELLREREADDRLLAELEIWRKWAKFEGYCEHRNTGITFVGDDWRCTKCGKVYWPDGGLPVLPKDAVRIESPKLPWIVRNWVELLVMATVLGVIGVIVWRAW